MLMGLSKKGADDLLRDSAKSYFKSHLSQVSSAEDLKELDFKVTVNS